jgi:prepilin-type N-terminal cleavage/methylation domain-containing protein
MKSHSPAKKGFTMIEVLVVLAIIGILTAILVANYTEARKNSRDKLRKSDLKSLQLAIELYKAQNGSYPPAGCGRGVWSWTGSSASFGSCTEYISGLAPQFIPALPQDRGTTGHGYIYMTDGTSYKVLSYQSAETSLVTSYADEFSRCPRNFGTAWCGATPEPNVYGVYSAGAEGW